MTRTTVATVVARVVVEIVVVTVAVGAVIVVRTDATGKCEEQYEVAAGIVERGKKALYRLLEHTELATADTRCMLSKSREA